MLRICAIEASALAGFLISTYAIEAQEPTVQRGRAFAQANCARCHAIGPSGESPLPKAPPFRTLHERYPVEDLMESLAEGIILISGNSWTRVWVRSRPHNRCQL
jgi:cytochrome c